MIQYQHFKLENGLQVYHHFDDTNPMAVFNLCYNVGSRDESPSLTGFAHLFEHLMFTGSINIPNYDTYVQLASGENNAFTSPDITNYYLTLPAHNIETAFWLESDRMLGLSFDQKGLEVQKKVVVEEYKQRYLNQPFGDMMLKLRPLAYKKHPYRWATIGKNIAHVEKASMPQVKSFFNTFYCPNNAILVVGGNVSFEQVKQLSQKYFANIPAQVLPKRNYAHEPAQNKARLLKVTNKVPNEAILKAFHVSPNYTDAFFVDYIINSILGAGNSSRLHVYLVENEPIMSQIHSSLTQSLDTGLLLINGMIRSNVDMKTADNAIKKVLKDLVKNGVTPNELQKVKSKAETILAYAETDLLQRAMAIAFAANAGKIDNLNKSQQILNAITLDQVNERIRELFQHKNSNTIYYFKNNEN